MAKTQTQRAHPTPLPGADRERTAVERATIWLLAAMPEDFPRSLDADWFRDTVCADAYRLLAGWHQQGQGWDVATLAAALGPTFADIMDWQAYAVAEFSRVRTAIDALRAYALRDKLEWLMRQVPARWSDPDETLSWLIARATEWADNGHEAQAHTAVQMAVDFHDAIEARNRDGAVKDVLDLGLESLDSTIEGIGPGEVVVLGGRPKTGKTQLALNWTEHWLRQDKAVLTFTFEMLESELWARMVAMVGSLNSKHVLRYPLHGEALRTYSESMGWLSGRAWTVYDEPLSWPEIAALIRRHRQRGEADVVVLDHLGLIKREYRRGQSTNDIVGEIVQGIRHTAQEVRVPIVVVSHLSRAVEHRQDKRPQAFDFRDSGEIEQTAHLALTVWHPAPQDLDGFGHREASSMPIECYVAAARSGPANFGVLLEWDRPTGRMWDGGASPYRPDKGSKE